MIQIENKCTKARKPKRNSSRKYFAQKKIAPHGTNLKTMEVRTKGFYSRQYKTPMKKVPKMNMKRNKLTTEKN
jgi:hypothetical protein